VAVAAAGAWMKKKTREEKTAAADGVGVVVEDECDQQKVHQVLLLLPYSY
jgi:hypothetical protein